MLLTNDFVIQHSLVVGYFTGKYYQLDLIFVVNNFTSERLKVEVFRV